MKSYLSYFRLRFVTGLQYRAAAIAGLSTQLFFGIIYVFTYFAFYESNSVNVPMEINQLVNYLWLNQIFFALIGMFYKDEDILNLIRSGNISYELARPQNLYFIWYFKILSQRLSASLMRGIPLILILFLIPQPYGMSLPSNFVTFLVFVITFILGVLLMTAITTLFHVITIFTLNEKGITNIMFSISEILSGLVVPIPFFPGLMQKISSFLPFKYVSDFPFRIYASHIPLSEVLNGVIIQLFWIVSLILLGNILTKKALKKAVVQGG